MVFGWGKKHQAEAPTQKEISIHDIRDMVSDLKSRRASQTIADAQRIGDMTRPLLKQLIDIAAHLDRDSLNVDDVDKNVGVLIKRGKKQVIYVIRKEVSVMDDIITIDDAFDVARTLGSILKKLGDVLGRQTRVIHLFAKKYANQLKHNLEDLKLHHAELESILNNYTATRDGAERIFDLLDKIKDKETLITKTSDRISAIHLEIKQLVAKINDLEADIQRERESVKYAEYLSLSKSRDSLDSQKSDLRNTINSQFTKISRPLGRYEYGSSLEKSQRPILEQLIHDPFVVMTQNNRSDITTILENVKKGIESGSISVKDITKSLSHMGETFSLLDEFISQVDELENRYDKVDQSIRSCNLDTLRRLESDLAQSKSSITSLNHTLTSYNEELEINRPLRKDLISDLESSLRHFSNTQYVVET